LQLQPNCVEAEVNLGNALSAQGQLSPEQQNHYAQLNRQLGQSRQQAGDLQTAKIYFQQALALNPNAEEVDRMQPGVRGDWSSLEASKFKDLYQLSIQKS